MAGGLKSSSGISTPSPSAAGNAQPANVNQKGRKDRKKTSLPFHQRKSTSTERSPTPPVTLSTSIKTINTNVGSVKGSVEMANNSIAQTNLPLNNSPAAQVQNAKVKTPVIDKLLDQSYSHVPIQSISPIKSAVTKTRKLDYSKKYNAACKSTEKRIDYALPSTMLPKRPLLATDRLEARSLSTDVTYSSLYVTPKTEGGYTVSEVTSPMFLQSANIKSEESVHEGEVTITRMPNKGLVFML